MSYIGYYRYKLDNLNPAEITKKVTFFVNNSPVTTHVVNISTICDGEKLIKYLDKDGQYIFVSFNKYWEGRNTPQSLGEGNKFIISILEAQSKVNQLGYKNKKVLSLYKTQVSASELLILEQILTSPRVYLKIGEEDNLQDWKQVKVNPVDTIYKHKKKSVNDFSIEVELPEEFSQTML